MPYLPSDYAAAKFYKLGERGLKYPNSTVRFARETGLTLSDACTMLEKESAGGHNVFGHDNVRNPVKGGAVTRARYKTYLLYRNRGQGANGVGPTQLTWPAYQDEADKQGGCWNHRINMRYGFNLLSGYIKNFGRWDAAKRYNGNSSYANDYMNKYKRWHDAFMRDQKDNRVAYRALRVLLRKDHVI